MTTCLILFGLSIAFGLGFAYLAYNYQMSKVVSRPARMPAGGGTDGAFFGFTLVGLNGRPVPLDQFRGKKVVIMNVASHCGFTGQYHLWEKFYCKHKDRVVVLGFPCNDFAGQEPGSSEDIARFCHENFGITFPMFEKICVKGPDQDPLYRWLTDPGQNGWNRQSPTWNFSKYLIDENGQLTHFFGPYVQPDNKVFARAINA
jgi:glutathione peroxidase